MRCPLRGEWIHKWWHVPTMDYYFTVRKEQTTNAGNMGESQKHDAVWKDRVILDPYVTGNFGTQAKLIYSEMKQMSGCWRWRGKSLQRGMGGPLFGEVRMFFILIDHIGVCQTIHLKWVHFMYVNSGSIKLIYEGEKGGHKHFMQIGSHAKEADQS